MSKPRRLQRLIASLAAAAAAVATSAHANGLNSVEDLQNLSIEELAQIKVTSVSKRPELLSDAPAAAYVITSDDIRRTGVLTLPEALRLAPNLEVSRLDAGTYAISARGFNGYETSNKLLVLVDGRSVYTPLFGGVFWETQNINLPDVDRVEVVSGPGGALWGANAVNGVINVISKDAHDTQGGLLNLAAGDVDRRATARWGGGFGATGAYRVYATGFQRGESATASGAGVGDDWSGVQAGFRADWGSGADRFTLQGDIYRDDLNFSASLGTPSGVLRGADVVGRWRHALSDTSSLEVQAYFDRAQRDSLVSDRLETWDIQAQQTQSLADGRHQLVWGGGYRLTRDAFINNLNPANLDPPSRDISLGNLFAQDEVALRPDLTLTVGLKVEDSTFTGVELMPNLRLAWKPTADSLAWASLSRAVRDPSRIERDFVFAGLVQAGTFDAEVLIAAEAGWKAQPTSHLSYSVSVYLNDWDRIRTNEFAPGGGFPVHVDNGIQGRNWGLEAWGAVDAAPWWRLTGGVNLISKDFAVRSDHADISNMLAVGNDPAHQVFIRSQMNFGAFDFDLRLRAIGDLPKPALSGYVDASGRLAWRVNDRIELAVVGENLLDRNRMENGDPARARAIPRSVWASLRWGF